jgi:hypothetical protein
VVFDEEANTLYAHVTLDEVKYVLSLFKIDKSPGPNGWTVEFFSTFFDLVGEYIVQMIEESRKNGYITGSLNSTFLAIIPKENKSTSFGDYRPISLCNLCYKMISKVIANQIKHILSSNLFEEQLGFLKGRRIQDAIGTAHEVLHSITKKKVKSLVLKLDLCKTYDCIDWDLLRMILIQMGFGIQVTKWIMSCVTYPTYAVLINGETTDFFRSGRCLRQGFPLSPLLFIMVMEGLSLLLKKSKGENKLSCIKVSRMFNILHLFFMDDILILTKVDLHEWLEIEKLIGFFSVKLRVYKLMFQKQPCIMKSFQS